MRELRVLCDGHLDLRFSDWKDFFEGQMGEQVRSQGKRMIEQGLEVERDYNFQLGNYEHAPHCRLDYRDGCYHGHLATPLGQLRGLMIPCTRLQHFLVSTMNVIQCNSLAIF